MREILFRGKRKDTNCWEIGSYMSDGVSRSFINGFEYEVFPETVGQYTGWNDIHQTKIFENDVIEFFNGITSHRYLIWWHREGNMMTAVPLNGMTFNGSDYWNGNYPLFEYSTFCLMMFDPYGDFQDIRVVGNIHDNPELLEGCKNYGTLDN